MGLGGVAVEEEEPGEECLQPLKHRECKRRGGHALVSIHVGIRVMEGRGERARRLGLISDITEPVKAKAIRTNSEPTATAILRLEGTYDGADE